MGRVPPDTERHKMYDLIKHLENELKELTQDRNYYAQYSKIDNERLLSNIDGQIKALNYALMLAELSLVNNLKAAI